MTRKMAQGHKITPIRRSLTMVLLFTLIAITARTLAQSPSLPKPPERPAPPTRDPHTPGYVTAKELPDGSPPPANVDGNFIIGPTHTAPPESPSAAPRFRKGDVIEFTMNSADSKFYPGIARDANTFGTPDPRIPQNLS